MFLTKYSDFIKNLRPHFNGKFFPGFTFHFGPLSGECLLLTIFSKVSAALRLTARQTFFQLHTCLHLFYLIFHAIGPPICNFRQAKFVSSNFMHT